MKRIKTYSTFLGENHHEQIPGGKSSGMSLLDIAKMHAYDDSTDSTSEEKIQEIYSHLKDELEKGKEYEMEHTSDPQKAEEIAMDHLYEDPGYYTKLENAGLAD